MIYHLAGGAMRINSTLYYVLKDHFNPAPAPGGGGGGGHHDDDDLPDSNPNGLTTCYPGELACIVENDGGFPTGSHDYTTTNVVCPAVWNCTQAEMIYYLSLFAYPGQLPFYGPAINYNYYSVGIFGAFPEGTGIYSDGLIQVTTLNGGLTSINTTMRSHIFCCGTVTRTLNQDASGAWTVTSYGTGSNTSVAIAQLNLVVGPALFNNMDSQMETYINNQKFPSVFSPQH